MVRFSAEGHQDPVIALPVPCPLDLPFGGEALQTLDVTSARQPVSLEALADAPLSGRLLLHRRRAVNQADKLLTMVLIAAYARGYCVKGLFCSENRWAAGPWRP